MTKVIGFGKENFLWKSILCCPHNERDQSRTNYLNEYFVLFKNLPPLLINILHTYKHTIFFAPVYKSTRHKNKNLNNKSKNNELMTSNKAQKTRDNIQIFCEALIK